MAFPVLPAIAAGLMGLGGGMSMFGKRNKAQTTRIPRFDEQGVSALNSLLSQGLANVDMDALENRYMDMYKNQMVPSIAERFTSMGEGGQGSSAFTQALNRGSSDLLGNLQSQRTALGMQQLGLGLTPKFESYFQPETPGLMQTIGANLMGAGTSMLPGAMGMQGGNLMSMLSGLLGGNKNRLGGS